MQVWSCLPCLSLCVMVFITSQGLLKHVCWEVCLYCCCQACLDFFFTCHLSFFLLLSGRDGVHMSMQQKRLHEGIHPFAAEYEDMQVNMNRGTTTHNLSRRQKNTHGGHPYSTSATVNKMQNQVLCSFTTIL